MLNIPKDLTPQEAAALEAAKAIYASAPPSPEQTIEELRAAATRKWTNEEKVTTSIHALLASIRTRAEEHPEGNEDIFSLALLDLLPAFPLHKFGDGLASEILLFACPDATHEQRRWCAVVHGEVCDGATWGEAVEKADKWKLGGI